MFGRSAAWLAPTRASKQMDVSEGSFMMRIPISGGSGMLEWSAGRADQRRSHCNGRSDESTTPAGEPLAAFAARGLAAGQLLRGRLRRPEIRQRLVVAGDLQLHAAAVSDSRGCGPRRSWAAPGHSDGLCCMRSHLRNPVLVVAVKYWRPAKPGT